MLLKRSLILAAGVLFFIVAFIAYFQISHIRMEDRFRGEREKFGVQGAGLTAAPKPAAPVPAAATPPDTNNLIGPVPPVNPSTTDGMANPVAPNTNAAPAAPGTNAAPTTTPAPSSTMNYPRPDRSPFFQLASYHPSDNAEVQFATAEMGAVATPPTKAAAASPAPAPLRPSTSNVAPTVAAPVAPGAAHPTKPEGKVIVLLYHQFKPAGVPIPAKFQWTMNQDVFESEMKYIHDNGYNVIPMSDLLKFLRHEITVPPNSVCITIDDGYKSAIVYAAPILKKYGFPWTFFIYPDFVTVAEGSGAVSWNDLLQLQAEGIDIESHSMTHPNLKLHHQKVKGVWHNFTPEEYAAWLNDETSGSKALLEQKLGRPVACFAYPYGEYNKQVEDAAIAAGYEAIFTVADNPVHPTTSLHSIGRYTITQGVEKNFTAYLRQGALGLSAADPAPGATISNPRPVITATLAYAGTLDPKSIETQVRDFGDVRHDFDPQTNTLRLYLPRDLIASVVLVNIRVKDAVSGQVMVANWHFNYAPEGAAANAVHTPIAPPATEPAAKPKTATQAATNAPEAAEPESLEKNAAGTPLDAHRITPAPSPASTNAPPLAPQKTD
jgi:peptidoglycan/xylan/chitin deacetylase (PgdA/CDA1 family)